MEEREKQWEAWAAEWAKGQEEKEKVQKERAAHIAAQLAKVQEEKVREREARAAKKGKEREARAAKKQKAKARAAHRGPLGAQYAVCARTG